MAKKTAVVILNYNGEEFLKTFLTNVVENSPSADVIVADNLSSDGSVDFLKSNHPDVQLIELDQNYGFTGGYNRVISKLDYEYTVLLNSDIEVAPNWLEPIINFMDSNPKVAACQPKILDYNQKEYFEYAGAAGGFIDTLGFPYCRGRVFDSLEKDSGQYNSPLQVFWATGAAMFVRTKLYNEVGGLDEDFFAHMEEIDLCWRLQRAGHEIYCIPDSTVYHVGGGTLNKINPRKTYFNFRNNLAMILKNESAINLVWKIPVKLTLDGIAAIKLWKDHSFGHFIAVIKAHFHFYAKASIHWRKRTSTTTTNTCQGPSKYILIDYFIKGKKKYNLL
ncbi:glycosyltransferase family 2 protein [Reichenbachiella versicolor]|uniref:glycosyltransferase family 2 protein n=1 Tax=Reichenbachiella versicolor TaxID=1821036 RepID=UPI000D6E17B3|nr:glycosyltransferase family 2 protein [Reichenbachiella versicolor]